MFTALLSHLRKPRQASPHTDLAAPESELDAEELQRGCGWFDSSHELRCGLQVTEHATADTVANELPLGDWLELHLSGWRSPQLA